MSEEITASQYVILLTLQRQGRHEEAQAIAQRAINNHYQQNTHGKSTSSERKDKNNVTGRTQGDR